MSAAIIPYFRCPFCGGFEKLPITIRATLLVDGSSTRLGSLQWTDDDAMNCQTCGFASFVAAFERALDAEAIQTNFN
jgi:hypothetical protein